MVAASGNLDLIILIGAAVVLLLVIIILFEVKIVRLISMRGQSICMQNMAGEVKTKNEIKQYAEGEAKLKGVEEDEITAAIIAAISMEIDLPLSAIRIKSIKRLDDGWSKASLMDGRIQTI